MKTNHTQKLTAEMNQEVKKMIDRKHSKHTLSAMIAAAGAVLALLGVLHLAKCKGGKVIFLLHKVAAAPATPEANAPAEGDAHAG